MLRLLHRISPRAADTLGGCLFYAIGIPLLVLFVLGFLLIGLSPGLGIKTGSPEMRTAFALIVGVAFVVDVAIYGLGVRNRARQRVDAVAEVSAPADDSPEDQLDL